MSFRIRRFEAGDEPAVQDLNARLAEHGVADRVYPESDRQPSETRGDPWTQELHVAVDDGHVRGAVWLHEHEFRLRGETIRAGWLKYPVSESLIDPAYSGVGVALIVSLMRRQPRLMALGMGGVNGPLAQLLAGFGWEVLDVPALAAPIVPSRVMAEMATFRRTTTMAHLSAAARWSGMASIAGLPGKFLRRSRTARSTRGVDVEVVGSFDGWADDVWKSSRDRYGLIARRDHDMLNALFRPGREGLDRLRVSRDGDEVGWVVTALMGGPDRPSHHLFGQLRVGLIADGLGRPEDAVSLLSVGIRHLESEGAELIFCNHADPRWVRTLKSMGFLSVPSNFAFAYSPRMRTTLSDGDPESFFLNRGDCDGPPSW